MWSGTELPLGELREMVGFLTHPRPDVQAEALRTVSGFVDHPDFLAFARLNAKAVVRPLLRLAEGDDAVLATDALPPLVNLAADEELVDTIVAFAAAKRTAMVLGAAKRFTLQVQFLANLTRRRAAAAQALEAGLLPRMVETLASTSAEDAAVDAAGKVLENCCALRSVRDATEVLPLCKLLPSKRRRLAALRVLLQLAQDAPQHPRLADPDAELCPRLGTFLYPNEAKNDPEYASRREDLDPLILAGTGLTDVVEERSAAARLLLRFGGTEGGRKAIQDAGIYEVIRAWHLVEADADVKDMLEDIAPLAQYTEQELEEMGVRPVDPAPDLGPSEEEREEIRAAKAAEIPFDEDDLASAELDTVD